MKVRTYRNEVAGPVRDPRMKVSYGTGYGSGLWPNLNLGKKKQDEFEIAMTPGLVKEFLRELDGAIDSGRPVSEELRIRLKAVAADRHCAKQVAKARRTRQKGDDAKIAKIRDR